MEEPLIKNIDEEKNINFSFKNEPPRESRFSFHKTFEAFEIENTTD